MNYGLHEGQLEINLNDNLYSISILLVYVMVKKNNLQNQRNNDQIGHLKIVLSF